MYRTPHFSAITKRILCLILLPTSSDAGGVQVCTHFEEDTESQARHASGTYYDSLYGTFEFVLFQLYVLKLLKMQTKYLGRQWRKSNMKTMSAIYTKVSPTAMDLQILEYVCQIFLYHQHNQTFVFLIFRNLR